MRNQLLRDSDWAGMSHSLEIRLPFLDIPLLQYLTQQRNIGNVLRKDSIPLTANPPLPNEIQFRKNTGFLIPIQAWSAGSKKNQPYERGLKGWQREVYNNYCKIN
jgi:asparagine synthase (glutamine-hydrolysing)